MSKKMFAKKQIKVLLNNKNVTKCSEKSITYNHKFKLKTIKQYYEQGLSPAQIFIEAGFNLSIIGRETPKFCLARWRKKYDTKGSIGLLNDNRGKHSNGGRPKKMDFPIKKK